MAEETKKKTSTAKSSEKAAEKTKQKSSAKKKSTAAAKATVNKTAKKSKGTAAAKTVEAKKAGKKEVSKKEFKEKEKVKKEVEKDFFAKKVDRNKTEFLKSQNVKRNWLILDASGKSLGRVAALAASLLRGKHKVDFTPNVDCGDGVIIINCKDTVLTGKKLYQKVRYRHSGWIGGLREIKYSVLMKTKPQEAMAIAVRGMLPHNSLGRKMAKHLRTYKDDRHENDAQNPQIYEF